MIKQVLYQYSSQNPDGSLMYPLPVLQCWARIGGTGVWILVAQDVYKKPTD